MWKNFGCLTYAPKRNMKRFILLFLYLLTAHFTNAQHKFDGQVRHAETKAPLEHVVVFIAERDIWTTTDAEGKFHFASLPKNTFTLNLQLLGFVSVSLPISITESTQPFIVELKPDNLRLDDVTVTAKRTSQLTTSYVIDQKALEHMQMLNVTDAASLLPGGKTNTKLHLANGEQQFAINGARGELGNALFGVGVEVDGVRLSTNGLMGSPTGIDTRNLASSNVESIEIITGVPSVEIGDATNGVVKINTRKGASKYTLDLVTKPNTKQVALSKGLDLGFGVLNVNGEHTKSISDIASPYTSYDRNSLSLYYTHTLLKNRKPLAIEYGITGNTGGFNSQSDPDRFVETYSKSKDNTLRSNLSLKWLLNTSWITNLEFYGSANFTNQTSEIKTNHSASSSVSAIHSLSQGYFVGQRYDVNPDSPILLIDPGYWYQTNIDESKAVNYSAKLKADHSFVTGQWLHKVKVGADYTASRNNGLGNYYSDMRFAPTWRPYPYNAIPTQHNVALYIENQMRFPLFNRDAQLTAGVRSDQTFLRESVYQNVRNLSPRIKGQYSIWQSSTSDVKEITLRAGWGKTVKLPSLATLFPQPSYRDILSFTPGTMSDGTVYYAYYTQPILPAYNPQLRWQSNKQTELGAQINYKGHRLAITYTHDVSQHNYISTKHYTPFTYKFTNQEHLQEVTIAEEDRNYTVDQQTGIVTVHDQSSSLPSQTLPYNELTRFYATEKPNNGSTVRRDRINWTIDFKRINKLRTSFRIDGNFYRYKGIEETIQAVMPNSTINMADGKPYKYIGFFAGGDNWSNGSERKSVDVNVTAITHIPAVKMIMTLRVESSLYSYSQRLSEYQGQQRGHVIDGRDSYLPSETLTNIYGGDRFVAVYPQYYTSLDDLSTPINFEEKFLWAQQNDPVLYNELAKLVAKTNQNYSFNRNTVSSYFSANLGITKEIGELASITFNATNFLNNMSQVRSSSTGTTTSLFGSTYIPTFYYGLSLKLKI